MDASSYDEICEKCGATDYIGGWGDLAYPCPVVDSTIKEVPHTPSTRARRSKGMPSSDSIRELLGDDGWAEMVMRLQVELATERSARKVAERERDELREFMDSCQCGECSGSGRADNHVNGETECQSCLGTGHDSNKAFSRLRAVEAALREIATWSQELQDRTVANGMELAQWRGCVAIAKAALSGDATKETK